jgi:OOP family OmpA-OmpF porin
MTFNRFKKDLFLVTLLTGIVACSSGPVVRDFPPTANPADEIANLQRDLDMAGQKQVNVLSPVNFKEASDSLDDAKKQFLNGKKSEGILHAVALGNSYLVNANNTAAVAHENIEEVIAAREAAVLAEAPTYFSRDFKNADSDFEAVTKDIEKNKMNPIKKERVQLQDKYLSLELKSIQEKNLKESRQIILQAKSEKAEKFAPRLLAVAEKSYTETEAFIKANPHKSDEIKIRAGATKDAAYHVFNINRTSKGTSKVSPEEIAVILEQNNNRAANNKETINAIADQLETTEAQLQDKNKEQAILLKTASALESEKEKLEAEKYLNEKYEVARKKFTPNEAEVYRQGDSLLIRLKGMEFASATSTIQSKNFPLLAKVETVVLDFGSGSTIMVEGHTDSVGGKIVNERLSNERANAVKEYLQKNGGGFDTKFEAVGYGYQKPLATNKTLSGRAQNRRVDIIIKPEAIKL